MKTQFYGALDLMYNKKCQWNQLSLNQYPKPRPEPTEEPKGLETVQGKSPPPLHVKRGRPPAAPDLTKSTITLLLANIVHC